MSRQISISRQVSVTVSVPDAAFGNLPGLGSLSMSSKFFEIGIQFAAKAVIPESGVTQTLNFRRFATT